MHGVQPTMPTTRPQCRWNGMRTMFLEHGQTIVFRLRRFLLLSQSVCRDTLGRMLSTTFQTSVKCQPCLNPPGHAPPGISKHQIGGKPVPSGAQPHLCFSPTTPCVPFPLASLASSVPHQDPRCPSSAPSEYHPFQKTSQVAPDPLPPTKTTPSARRQRTLHHGVTLYLSPHCTQVAYRKINCILFHLEPRQMAPLESISSLKHQMGQCQLLGGPCYLRSMTSPIPSAFRDMFETCQPRPELIFYATLASDHASSGF